MLKKWTSFLLMVLVFNLAAGPLAFGQTNDDKRARAAAKIKEKIAKIGMDKKITVRRQNKTEVTGYLSAIDADSFTIDDKINGPTSFSYAEVAKVSREGASKALTIGLIAGLAAGAAIILVILIKPICNEGGC